MSDELLPCPFCGGEAKSHKTDIGPGYQTSHVKCKSCPADVGKIDLDAETFWNSRQPAFQERELDVEVGARGIQRADDLFTKGRLAQMSDRYAGALVKACLQAYGFKVK